MNVLLIHNLIHRIIVVTMLTFAMFYIRLSVASAHKVSIYAYAEDGKIYAEGYFVDGSKAKNSIIEVFDLKSGEKLLETKTDNNGEASFDIPKTGALKLILTASMGHKNDYVVPENEIRQAMGEKVTEDIPVEPEIKTGYEKTGKENELNAKEVERIVERVVDKKLQPIKTILVQTHETLSKPGLTEILGGIGYIIGLMGIILYFKSKR